MATDKTWFDDYLKENLVRDLLFRSVAWAVISGMTIHSISLQASFSSFEYFTKSVNALMPVVTQVLATASVLSLAALLLKDLEHVSPGRWGQTTLKGRFGGFVRRLAGDLTLWIIGSMVTLLVIIVFGAAEASRLGTDDKAVGALSALVIVPAVGAFVVGVLNVLIRRARSPTTQDKGLAQFLTTPVRVVAFYVALICFTAVVGSR